VGKVAIIFLAVIIALLIGASVWVIGL